MSGENAPLTVLGIETSCDETAAAVVVRQADGTGSIRSDVVFSQVAEHAPYGGVVPEIAARAHIEILDRLIGQALDEAGTDWTGIHAVAATAGPGLIGGVMVGLMTAKGIALARGLPLVAVNHLEGHALSVRLVEPCPFPYLLLLVSGGHTQLLEVEGVGRYRQLGTTKDDAAGEAFDKTAKLLGLGFPGGPAVEAAASKGDPCRFALPRPMMGRQGADFSFSGLKTAVRHTLEALGRTGDQDRADLAASFQAAVADVLEDRAAAAMRLFAGRHEGTGGPLRFVVAGGVAANGVLRERLQRVAEEGGFRLVVPPPPLCTDNAAMIAWAGAERLALGLRDPLETPARARWPLSSG